MGGALYHLRDYSDWLLVADLKKISCNMLSEYTLVGKYKQALEISQMVLADDFPCRC